MGSPRIRIAWLGAALVLFILLLALPPGHGRLGGARPAARQPAPDGGAGPQAAALVAAPPAAGPEERSRLADGLTSQTGDVHSDLRLIDGILLAYRSALRSGNPVGENSDITAALMGRNRMGYAFIPAGTPAVSAKGELCDRWGTPYFFHQLSGERMEIRSAGPDRRMWTPDDEVLTP